MIKQLSYVCLYMDDLKDAERIFVDTLGFPYAHEYINGDNKLYGFSVDAGNGTLVKIFQSDLYTSRFAFYVSFEVNDIYKMHHVLTATEYDVTPVKRNKSDKVLQFFWYPKSLSIELTEHDNESVFKQKGLV